MRKINFFSILILMGFLTFACNPVVITPKGPLPPTFTPTVTITPTPMHTFIPTCGISSSILYSDDFSNSNTLVNYEYLDRATGRPIGIQITGGELVMTPNGASTGYNGASGAELLVKDSVLSHALSNYTLDFDAKMDSLPHTGYFGAAVRGNLSSPNMTCY